MPAEIGQDRDGDPADHKLLTALTTEHFVLQSIRGGISGEATSRAALYLSALSASLVALGFAVGKGVVFGYLAGAVLPMLAALGLLTFVRLVEIGIEDIDHLAGIMRIRRYYAGLSPRAASFFPHLEPDGAGRPDAPGDDGTLRFQGLEGSRWQLWFTAASLVGVINSIVVGAGAALGIGSVGVLVPVAAVAGTAVAFGLVAVHLTYQRRRYVAATSGRQQA